MHRATNPLFRRPYSKTLSYLHQDTQSSYYSTLPFELRDEVYVETLHHLIKKFF